MPGLPSRRQDSTSWGLLISVHLVLYFAAFVPAADPRERQRPSNGSP